MFLIGTWLGNTYLQKRNANLIVFHYVNTHIELENKFSKNVPVVSA